MGAVARAAIPGVGMEQGAEAMASEVEGRAGAGAVVASRAGGCTRLP